MTAKPIPLAELARRLDRAAIPWAVFAGAAAAAYGASRPLTDVDILIPAAAGARAAALFPEAEVKRRADGAVRGLDLPDFDLVAGLRWEEEGAVYAVDLDAEMRARLTEHEIEGVVVPVIPAEDNVLLKALWGRGAEQGKHDWADVHAMLAHRPTLDWDYLRWRARQCGPEPRMTRLLGKLREIFEQKHTLDDNLRRKTC
jgi:hypothetical protein